MDLPKVDRNGSGHKNMVEMKNLKIIHSEHRQKCTYNPKLTFEMQFVNWHINEFSINQIFLFFQDSELDNNLNEPKKSASAVLGVASSVGVIAATNGDPASLRNANIDLNWSKPINGLQSNV